jgi:hypothetical protein
MKYTFTNDNGQKQISVIVDGVLHTIDGSHDNFDAVLAGCRAGDIAAVKAGIDLRSMYKNIMGSIGHGFTYDNDVLSYKGVPVSQSLARTILDQAKSGDVTPFVNFARRLNDNPSYRSQTLLFDWIMRHGLTLTENGKIVAYKGARLNENGDYVSIHSGFGIVNGEAYTGHLSNAVGNVVEVPRQRVDDNPNSHCSYGLHAGTYEYAKNFGKGVLLTVEIDPEDVVSIPNDGEKIRCSKYVVLATTEVEVVRPVWDGVTTDFEEDELCEECYETENYCFCGE